MFQLGDVVKADMFVEGDFVDVTGTSKGKGYAGVIKRFNASRLRSPTVPARFTVTLVPWARALILPRS